jgi:hypothetical protein
MARSNDCKASNENTYVQSPDLGRSPFALSTLTVANCNAFVLVRLPSSVMTPGPAGKFDRDWDGISYE